MSLRRLPSFFLRVIWPAVSHAPSSLGCGSSWARNDDVKKMVVAIVEHAQSQERQIAEAGAYEVVSDRQSEYGLMIGLL